MLLLLPDDIKIINFLYAKFFIKNSLYFIVFFFINFEEKIYFINGLNLYSIKKLDYPKKSIISKSKNYFLYLKQS